ncbi:MAG: ubiquinone/menaquinone biosynthesis C-methylase UbiE [Chlamydiales bacterium]|jgi:ubiquinone/menaquinone biosynthesis C-methylase UbiE
MKQGDFSKLAQAYRHRTGYSQSILKLLSSYVRSELSCEQLKVADVGAGTGKLTEQLYELGFDVSAVEPNDAMREEGILSTNAYDISWSKGSGEETGLKTNSLDWVFMASSFHWTTPALSLPEFSRILKPGGFLSVLWNPRDLENSPLQKAIDQLINKIAPNIQRVSSGSSKYTQNIEKILTSTNHFNNVIFTEGYHQVNMGKDRYMGAWESVNDIQSQAGQDKWHEILLGIRKEIDNLDEVIVPYKTRAWTVQKS